jgi:hypothetical protein
MTSFTPHDILTAVTAHAEKDALDRAAARNAQEAAAWAKTQECLLADYGIPVGAATRSSTREPRVWSGLLETDIVLAGVTLRTVVRSDVLKRGTKDNFFGDYVTLEHTDRKGRVSAVTPQDLASLLAGAVA